MLAAPLPCDHEASTKITAVTQLWIGIPKAPSEACFPPLTAGSCGEQPVKPAAGWEGQSLLASV